ncbi:MAG: histidine kinase dimerization/phospho-acceptor domain-containing protein, partial [Pseudomonadota bacterium]
MDAPIGSVVELNALARAFNRMRDGVLTALEGERAARKAANAASEAKSRFLATMSHEIRTPMNGVIGAADLLSRTSQDTSQRFLIETIVGSGEALLGLINDILDFSRLEAREVELSHAPFDPRETIESVAAMSARIADAKELAVVVDIRPSAEGMRLGDEGRFRQ